MYIDRHIEGTLRKAEKQTKVILITGARQVGKTTSVKEVFPQYEYITLDDENELMLALEDRTLFFKDRHFPLIIDEVQYAKEIFLAVKHIVDKNTDKGQIFLTGSQTYELLSKTSESLAGRVSMLEMTPLSLREILKVKNTDPFLPNEEYIIQRENELRTYDALWSRIHRGFYPDLYDTDRDWSWFYRDYIRTYIERDVRKIINIKDEIKFRSFLSSVAALSGQLLKFETIANAVGIDIKTAQSWISVLNASGLIKLIPAYQNNALKRAIKTPKLYMMDTGLLCYLAGWTTMESAKNGAMSGAIFETFVVDEIIKSYLNAGENTEDLFYYRDKEKREIDLLIRRGRSIYPIEIKKGATVQKQWCKNFKAIQNLDGFEVQDGCVLCRAERKTSITENVYALPVEYL